ncbi:MAG: sugar-binding domain-containing protein, partial [Chloroflexota bacterium]
LGLSRIKVSRLLKEARNTQVVQIHIDWPIQRDLDLEMHLQQAFGLKSARVLKTTSQNHVSNWRRLGQLGATYLEKVLKDGATMAVCLGRSTYEVINAIRPNFQANVRVAQAMGSMPFTLQPFDSGTLARKLAKKLGGEVLYLSSPLMADTSQAAEVIRSQRGIAQTLEAARQADVALLGIGNLDPLSSGFVAADVIPPSQLEALVTDGAVGDVAGQIYTYTGQRHQNSYNDRIIGVTLSELRDIPTTVAVAMGQQKARAILGGLRTGAINVLCTDTAAAKEALRLANE